MCAPNVAVTHPLWQLSVRACLQLEASLGCLCPLCPLDLVSETPVQPRHLCLPLHTQVNESNNQQHTRKHPAAAHKQWASAPP